MKLICLAGQDEIKDISRLKRKIKKRAKAEGHNYLWDRYKPLININGKPAINYVLKAINDSKTIHRAVVVGSSELEEKIRGFSKISFVEQGKNYHENLVNGYGALSAEKHEYIMVISADLPMLTGEIIDAANKFYEKQLHESNADFVMPLVSKSTLGEFPRKYFTVQDDLFKNIKRKMKESNFYYISGNADFRYIGKLFEMRKMLDPENWFKLVGFIFSRENMGTFGMIPRMVYHAAGKKITLSYAQKHLGKLIGCKVKFIESVFPEFSMDLDSEEDLKIIESHLQKR